jgi:hypothetical protein
MKINKNNNIIEIVFDQSLDSKQDQLEQAQELKENLEEIYANDESQNYGLLIDITQPDLKIESPIEAIKIYENILKMNQTNKMAVLGKRSFADKLIDIVLKNKSENKASWFVLREEALLWLSM